MIRSIIVMFFGIVNSLTISPKFVKEAEIKHGRLAMVSSLAIPLLDNVKPDTLGVNFINSLDLSVQLTLLGIFGCSEFGQMINAYKFPSTKNDWFEMKDEHEAGNYSFDPLSLTNKIKTSSATRAELDVGRVAMLGVVCEMVNELCTGNKVF